MTGALWEEILERWRERIIALERRGVDTYGAWRQLDYVTRYIAPRTVPPAAVVRVSGGRPMFRICWQSPTARATLTLSPAAWQACYRRFYLQYSLYHKRPLATIAVELQFNLPDWPDLVAADMRRYGWIPAQEDAT